MTKEIGVQIGHQMTVKESERLHEGEENKMARNSNNHPSLIHVRPVSPEKLQADLDKHYDRSMNSKVTEHELGTGSGLAALDDAYNSHSDRQGSSTPTCIAGGGSREYQGEVSEGKPQALRNPESNDSAGAAGGKLSTPDGSRSLGRHWSQR
jgi:hypothetical protein